MAHTDIARVGIDILHHLRNYCGTVFRKNISTAALIGHSSYLTMLDRKNSREARITRGTMHKIMKLSFHGSKIGFAEDETKDCGMDRRSKVKHAGCWGHTDEKLDELPTMLTTAKSRKGRRNTNNGSR